MFVFQGEASRYIFLNKFRKFLQENASNRGVRRDEPVSIQSAAQLSVRQQVTSVNSSSVLFI